MQNPGLTSSSFTNLIPTPTFKFKVVLIVNTPGVISMIDIRLIGWYCQKVNAQYPLNANHFMHTYKTTLKKNGVYLCFLNKLKLRNLNLILTALHLHMDCKSIGIYPPCICGILEDVKPCGSNCGSFK